MKLFQLFLKMIEFLLKVDRTSARLYARAGRRAQAPRRGGDGPHGHQPIFIVSIELWNKELIILFAMYRLVG
mgnify:CR=1 FL=1